MFAAHHPSLGPGHHAHCACLRGRKPFLSTLILSLSTALLCVEHCCIPFTSVDLQEEGMGSIQVGIWHQRGGVGVEQGDYAPVTRQLEAGRDVHLSQAIQVSVFWHAAAELNVLVLEHKPAPTCTTQAMHGRLMLSAPSCPSLYPPFGNVSPGCCWMSLTNPCLVSG